MKVLHSVFVLFLLTSFVAPSFAQPESSLLDQIGGDETTTYTIATFKTNRIVNGHSIENTAKGVLDFKISHRFSPIRNGIYDLIGLDGAGIRFGADYGITDRLMVGIGRSSFEKIIDGFVKYKILRQSAGQKNMPITLSYLVDAQVKTIKFADETAENHFSDRIYYTHQLLIGRKVNEAISLQVMPTLVHRNLVATDDEKNSVLSLGLGGRIKLNNRVTFNAEYYYVLPDQINDKYTNSLSLGFDIDTGGHVFQFHVTNSPTMNYKGFITETQEPWFFKDDATGKTMSGLRLGFNIARVFTIVKPKGVIKE